MIPNTPVLVTTSHRGVFFGYIESQDGTTVTLIRMRNCLSWSEGMKGFLGLAIYGPDKNCRVGPPATRSEITDVTSISECTADAVANWEAAPWSK
jgi:hypothetical protein